MTPASDASLPAALRAATAQVIIERGLGSFSLREVARRAGVSHAAPGYHFGDMRGLLTSLATEGFETLLREMQSAAAGIDDCRERLTAIGCAYVNVAIDYPAHMQVIFHGDVTDQENPEMQLAGQRAFAALEDTVAEIAATHNPDLDARVASQMCWSAMQGLVQLHPSMMELNLQDGLEAEPIETLVSRFTDLILMGIARPV